MLGVFLRRNSASIRLMVLALAGRNYSSKSDLDVLLKKMKLSRFQCFEKRESNEPYLEVLRNNHEDLDLVHVRRRQPQVLYLRAELLLQRISFLEPFGMSPQQKRKLIEQSPPVLVLDYDAERIEGRVGYVRGLVRQKTETESEEKLVHILHPCSLMVVLRSYNLQRQVKFIQEQLAMAQQTALRLLLNTPCFLLHNIQNMTENFLFIHKFVLPQGFSLDQHTAELYPPVYKKSSALNRRIFKKDAIEDLVDTLPTVTLGEVLDYSYPEHEGKGKPEDLVEFLMHAERRDLRPRYNKLM